MKNKNLWFSLIAVCFSLTAARAAEQYLGKVTYEGGFAESLELELSPAQLVKEIQVKVPSFCNGVEVLEVKTRTEGIWDNTTPVPGRPYRYRTSTATGSRVSAIALTLNGPSSQSCTIPVYKGDSSVNPTPVSYSQRRLFLINRTNTLAKLANEKKDIEVLRFLQEIHYRLVVRTPTSLGPFDNSAYWNAVLDTVERTLNTAEKMLNGSR